MKGHDKIMAAVALVEQLAEHATMEEEWKESAGAEDYEDVDEYIADLSDDRLMDALGEFMDFIKAAREIARSN